jgi:uncharacterized membrane protein YgcG
MVVVLVLIIALGIGLAAASGRFNLSTTRHEQQQAYYTALSSTQTIANWIISATEEDASAETVADVDTLLAAIPSAADDPDGIDIVTSGLPETTGSCTVNLRYVDEADSTLKISSTATFAGATDTVSLTLTKVLADSSSGGETPPLDLEAAEHDAQADEIGALKSDGIVPLYEIDALDNSSRNQTDLATLAKKIDADSSREARWTNVDVNGTGAYVNRVLGTQRHPINPQFDSDTDNRRFMVPANGRIMIDPLEDGVYFSDAEGGINNTKISSLAIDNTAGKDVRFRLASGSAALGQGATVDRSKAYLNSLLMFNFTDNAGSTETLSYKVDGKAQSYIWHPEKWTGLDLYVQAGSQVKSNLILAPFGHKYESYLDYWSWGNFVDNWHGTTYKEYLNLWPYALSPSTNGGKYLGLPIFPVDYGRDARFWILDGRSDRYFRVMQGVNIIEGSVYSNRPTIIGGGLLRDGEGGMTKEKVNHAMPGYSLAASTIHSLYVDATVRYSQLIYNTDIILKAPNGTGTAQSTIYRPYTWNDKTVVYHNFDKDFNPTMTIKGGTIYVGERQSLTIQGTVTAPPSGSATARSPLDNMWISPDKIVVAAGGTLTINKSETTNVLTDIHVDGGTLVIQAGAKIRGKIYTYNGGVVDAKGDYQLDSGGAGGGAGGAGGGAGGGSGGGGGGAGGGGAGGGGAGGGDISGWIVGTFGDN